MPPSSSPSPPFETLLEGTEPSVHPSSLRIRTKVIPNPGGLPANLSHHSADGTAAPLRMTSVPLHPSIPLANHRAKTYPEFQGKLCRHPWRTELSHFSSPHASKPAWPALKLALPRPRPDRELLFENLEARTTAGANTSECRTHKSESGTRT